MMKVVTDSASAIGNPERRTRQLAPGLPKDSLTQDVKFSAHNRLFCLAIRPAIGSVNGTGDSMSSRLRAAVAAIFLIAGCSAAQAAAPCDVRFFPAPRLQSVGEDFDQVKRVDQDLQQYDQIAGRRLEWLTPARQKQLLAQVEAGSLLGFEAARLTMSDTPLKRSEALGPGPHSNPAPACLVEVMVPQLIMERGGLAKRSLRLFGVVRTYQDGRQVKGYSSFAAEELPGFRMKAPEDAPAATQLVEQAYVAAVKKLIVQSYFHAKSN
jgi:hypothetical protein